MKISPYAVKDSIVFEHGLDIDLHEAWRKLIDRQFTGDAGRGFVELIQNALDSYDKETPWNERRIDVLTGNRSISVTDYGEGLDRERIRLVTELGGTDKRSNSDKIGMFGIGFFSMFNPALKTKEVRLTTRCEGYTVELHFKVKKPEEPPTITYNVSETPIDYSTRIFVRFDDRRSPDRCLRESGRYFDYYPCSVTVNGKAWSNVWQKALERKSTFFEQGACHGFLEKGNGRPSVTLLCKYEHLMELNLYMLLTGGHNLKFDLRDYRRKNFPMVPDIDVTVSCNDLSVTISRDSFSMDGAYSRMVGVLRDAYTKALRERMDTTAGLSRDLVLANQYILAQPLKSRFEKLISPASEEEDDLTAVCRYLAEEKIYRLSGRTGLFSLIDLKNEKREDVPLWYSERRSNLNWLGGAFSHDFIVLPERCNLSSGAPDLYKVIFGEIFKDAVNLDTIRDDPDTLYKLVERGIVTTEALTPKTELRQDLTLNDAEKGLIKEIDALLERRPIREVIQRALHLPITKVRTAFFEVEGRGINVSAGIFDKDGAPLSDFGPYREETGECFVGLGVNDPFIARLIESDDPHRVYYSLTYLAHRLTACQEQLVPYTRLFHEVKDTLAEKMRDALIEVITNADTETVCEASPVPNPN